MQKTGKLELTWVGKYDEVSVEPRILIEDPSKSYGDPNSENMLIHGDNLIALQALQQDYAGKIKCIYIDPPYNTGSAFEHYDDNLEHSTWLNLMKSRLELLKRLLSSDGSIWVNLDDNEVHYCKVMMDEIFGRENFLCDLAWEKRYSPPPDTKEFGYIHDHILVYRKTTDFKRNLLPFTDEQTGRYKNPDNDPRGPWKAMDYTCRFTAQQRPNLYYPIIQPLTGEKVWPKETRVWANSKEEHEKNVLENRLWWGASGKNKVPAKKNFLSDIQQGMMPMSLWHYDFAGTNQDAKKESMRLFASSPFGTPKPERLLELILTIASNPSDIVLDSFLGSGTTVAVAHKMKRKWIGIELGEHAYTHCKIRLDKVIDGEQGGISKSVNWQGGGGYKFYELAPSLLVKNPVLPVYQINPEYTFEMLCEAICKIEGFRYKVDGVYHGYSSEKRFIHITKEFINVEYIKIVAATLGEDQSLLIYGTKIQSGLRLPDNIEVKKIPKDLLEKCTFESEVR